MDEHDLPFDRVRRADPAAGAELDLSSLRGAVDARLAADAAAPAAAPADELAERRRRRGWTAWPARVAGVAAAALVVGGGGGYALGAAGDGGGGAGPAADVITLGAAGGSAESSAADAPMAAGSDTAASSRLADPGFYGSGRTVFTASGLSDEGATARAWALDAAGAFTEQTIAALAAALGVTAAPALVDGTWQAGPADGSGPSVSMYPDGTASVSYYDPTKDPWSCAVTLEQDAASSGDAATSLPAPDPCTQRDLGAAPSGDAAAATLRDLLAAVGLDPATFEIVPEEYSDGTWTYVTAHRVVDGQRSGLAWSAAFTGAGLQSVSGSVAGLVDLGEYAVVSPVEAVERLGDPRFGASWSGPIAWAEAADARVAQESLVAPEPTTPGVPATVAPGSALGWPVDEVTLTGARLGLAMHTQPDGAVVLAPTYELSTSDDSATWSVIAVATDRLDLTGASR